MSRFFARLALSIAALLVMLVAACMATGYFAYALNLFLAQYMSPPLAAVLTGFLILLLAGLLVAATQMGSRRRRSYEKETTREARESAAELGGELGRKLQGFAEAHKSGALIAALVAGFAVGVSPKLREFLVDILKK
jgi:membrane protein implicated in regulation of membrane protease activity